MLERTVILIWFMSSPRYTSLSSSGVSSFHQSYFKPDPGSPASNRVTLQKSEIVVPDMGEGFASTKVTVVVYRSENTHIYCAKHNKQISIAIPLSFSEHSNGHPSLFSEASDTE